jgi:hypothetical protein
MKIYNRVVIDVESGKIIEEDSFEYSGPLAELKGDTTVEAPKKTETEEATDAAYLKYIQSMQDRLDNPDKYKTETEKMMDEYGVEIMQHYMDSIPEQEAYNDKMMQYMTQLIDYNTQQLQNAKTIEELASYTGELTTEEKTMLDQVAQNSIDKITSTVNEETADIVSAKIADLVSKGVLDSTVGQNLLGDVAESAQKAIAQGATDVETARLQQELSIQQTNKDRALNWANYGLNQQQIFSNLANQNFSTMQAPLVNASNIASYSSNLKNQWSTNLSNMLGGGLSAGTSGYNTRYQSATQQAIANSQNATAQAGSKWGAVGTGVGVAAGIAIAV